MSSRCRRCRVSMAGLTGPPTAHSCMSPLCLLRRHRNQGLTEPETVDARFNAKPALMVDDKVTAICRLRRCFVLAPSAIFDMGERAAPWKRPLGDVTVPIYFVVCHLAETTQHTSIRQIQTLISTCPSSRVLPLQRRNTISQSISQYLSHKKRIKLSS